jgi:hypothetical protein
MTELGQAGPSSSPLRVRVAGENKLTTQAAATSPEKDLIAIYSSVVQGVKTEVCSLVPHILMVAEVPDRISLFWRTRFLGFQGVLDDTCSYRFLPSPMGLGPDHCICEQACQR